MGLLDFLLDVWDWMLDTGEQIGEFFLNIGDFFADIGDFFVDIAELDLEMGGIMFGIFNVLIVFILSKWMLTPFLQYMNPFQKIFWTVLTYVVCFIGGYFLGEKLFGD